MSDTATFTEHIDKVCSKASHKSGWILRTFACRQTYFMKLMWKSLVQGHIDYSSQLYQPLQSSNLTRIEQIQRTFTSKIPEVRHLSYWERLRALKMNSQQRRLERYRIIYTWKVLEGLVPNPGLEQCHSDTSGRKCRIPTLRRNRKNQNNKRIKFPSSWLFNSLPNISQKNDKMWRDRVQRKVGQIFDKNTR